MRHSQHWQGALYAAGRPRPRTALEAASIEKIQSSINKCLANVSSNLLIRDKKADERWAALL
jgi:hypothetical protein